LYQKVANMTRGAHKPYLISASDFSEAEKRGYFTFDSDKSVMDSRGAIHDKSSFIEPLNLNRKLTAEFINGLDETCKFYISLTKNNI
jgi:hypothetical protein